MTEITPNSKLFFDIVMQGLEGEVTGDDFWTCVDEDASFEFSYRFPNLPPSMNKSEYIEWFKSYDNNLEWAGNLKTYKDRDKGVVILDYEVEGVSAVGNPYRNRFCSIVKIKNKKIVNWVDFCDTYSAAASMIKEK